MEKTKSFTKQKLNNSKLNDKPPLQIKSLPKVRVAVQKDESETSMSEYRASYTWKTSFHLPENRFDSIVQNLIVNFPSPASLEVDHKLQGDEYEKLVQERIIAHKEKSHEDGEQTQKNQSEDVFGVNSQKQEPQPNVQPPPKKVPLLNKNKPPSRTNSGACSSSSPRKNLRKSIKKSDLHASQKNTLQNHLPQNNANVQQKVEVTSYEPSFYLSPKDAPSQERACLVGPIWVYWPEDKPFPPEYFSLSKVLK
jgi:hypothetical protein